jgi:hypothetical protein
MTIPEEISIGKYTLRRWVVSVDEDSIWIELPGGEGGQFPEEALERLLDEFYEKNF